MDSIYPSVGFYFQVSLDNESYSFKEVSGISLEINTEEITEGGENRFKYRVPTGAKYNNLELKRGLLAKNSNLMTWINNTLNSEFDKPITPKALEISLLNEEGNKVMSWSFVGAWPISQNSSSLNAIENEVLIESIIFSYNYFTTKVINDNN